MGLGIRHWALVLGNAFSLQSKSVSIRSLATRNPDFNRAKFTYNYTISYDHRPQDILLVLLATYSANYYIAAMSSAATVY
jgi:hypothetical protein